MSRDRRNDILLGHELSHAVAVQLLDADRPVAIFRTSAGANCVYRGGFSNPLERAVIAAAGVVYDAALNSVRDPECFDAAALDCDPASILGIIEHDCGSLQSDAAVFRRKSRGLDRQRKLKLISAASQAVALAVAAMQRPAFSEGLAPAFARLPEGMGLRLTSLDRFILDGARLPIMTVGWREFTADDPEADAQLKADAMEILAGLAAAGVTTADQILPLLDAEGI
jgi:hypothetical protein